MSERTRKGLLLVSTIAALCLFITPSKIMLLISMAVFLAVLAAVLRGAEIQKPVKKQFIKTASLCVTILVAFIGYRSFVTSWFPSSKVSIVSSALHIPKHLFLSSIAIVGCVFGSYAMYCASRFFVKKADELISRKELVRNRARLHENFKSNWFYSLSAIAFFFLNASPTIPYLLGICIAAIIAIFISAQRSSLWKATKNVSGQIKLYALLSAAGICLADFESFYKVWSASSKAQALEELLPLPIDLPLTIGALGAIVALYFAYICLVFFVKNMMQIVRQSALFDGFCRKELLVYSFIFFAASSLMVFTFLKSQAFYGTDLDYDIIYTSDSPLLVKGNVFHALTHPENDLRQPLFAVFAAPFMGIPYLLGCFFNQTVQAILLDLVQILLMIFANFMLAKIMNLSAVRRICFVAITSTTYTFLLFSLMMEQYIVAYFWLIFYLYLSKEKTEQNRFVLWGAGGTLLTSLVLMPTLSVNSPLRNFKEWLDDMVNCGLEFVALMLAFCRFDVIYYLTSRISFLSGFTGESVPFIERVLQYAAFIRGCFFAPAAGVDLLSGCHISWQLLPVATVDMWGILIFFATLLSAAINRKKYSSRICAAWVGFSIVMLLIIGWGTAENGLILYSLYFGWAYAALLFQLIETIVDKLCINWFFPVITLSCCALLLFFNIPAILKMIDFATTYYPA